MIIAKNFRELRDKFETFNKLKVKSTNKAFYKQKFNDKNKIESEKTSTPTLVRKTQNNSALKCYNCNEYGHMSKNCANKKEGLKCFKCYKFGHKANECNDGKEDGNVNLCSSKIDVMKISAVIEGQNVCALVDTGSSRSLLRSDIYLKTGAQQSLKSKILLTGLGGTEIETFGCFNAKILIQQEQFNVPVHVVGNDVIPVDFLIGCDLINEANVTINENGLLISKKNDLCAVLVDECSEKVDVSHIFDKNDATAVKQLCENYSPNAIKKSNVVCKIILKDETPISQNPRRLSIHEGQIVDSIIDEWLSNDIIEPSVSEFASPIVLVSKKDGSKRLCVDYRRINRQIIRDKYPLPRVDDQLDRLQGVNVFSVIDLKNGFFHVDVDEDSRKYTSFVCPTGQYQFKRVPFGLCNSPSVFVRFINDIFRDLVRRGVMLVYMDDIMVLANTNQHAIENLKLVLTKASEYGLKINWKKCEFLVTRVEYLGHVIENNTVGPSELKVNAVKKFPEPKTVKQLQQFLGLTGHFRKFIFNYSIIARPLSNLLRDDVKFVFQEREKIAFDSLKKCLTDKPVLRIFQHGVPTELHTDASMYGYGAVLLQVFSGELHPVYFASKKTSDAEMKYHSYELEVLAIIYALRKFRVYLIGVHFKIVTDCSVFEMTMRKQDLPPRVARWALSLEEFDYVIEHRAATRMRHVDALSRNPVMVIEGGDGVIIRIKHAQRSDDFINMVLKLLENGDYEDFVIDGEILYKIKDGKQLLVVPKKMQIELIRRYHEIGHYGVRKVAELINRDFWMAKIDEKIMTCIKNCVHCILNNRKQGRQDGFLHPIDKQNSPLQTIHLDHLTTYTNVKKV